MNQTSKSKFIGKASFIKWLNSAKLKDVFEECEDDSTISEIPDDYWAAESIIKLLEKAFEAGYNLQQEMKS